MAIPAYTLAAIEKLSPCEERIVAVKALKLGRRKITVKQAFDAGVTFDDLVWALSALSRNDKDVERRLRLWMSDVAAHVLHVFEKYVANDDRPRKAIQASRDFANGKIGVAAGADAGDAAWAAAGAAAGAAAWAAARAAAGADAGDAAWAAARAAAGDAAWAAARAAAGADAGDAAWAAAGAAAGDDAGAAEKQWQQDRLIHWFNKDDPSILHLKSRENANAKHAA